MGSPRKRDGLFTFAGRDYSGRGAVLQPANRRDRLQTCPRANGTATQPHELPVRGTSNMRFVLALAVAAVVSARARPAVTIRAGPVLIRVGRTPAPVPAQPGVLPAQPAPAPAVEVQPPPGVPLEVAPPAAPVPLPGAATSVPPSRP